MKKIYTLVITSLILIILQSCSNTLKPVTQDEVVQINERSIVYGIFRNIPANLDDLFDAVTVKLYEKNSGKDFELPLNRDYALEQRDVYNKISRSYKKQHDIVFAYYIQPGTYEIRKLVEYDSYAGGGTTYTYFFFNTNSYTTQELYDIENKLASTIRHSSKEKIINTLQRSELTIPSNKIIYIGEWERKFEINPFDIFVTKNKKNTDAHIKKFFKNLDTENAISIYPN